MPGEIMQTTSHGRQPKSNPTPEWKCPLNLHEQFVHFNPEDPYYGAGPDRLDASELTVDSGEIDRLASAIRFGTGELERLQWLKVLDSLDLPHNTKERFRNCGQNPWVEYCPDTDRVRLRTDTCKSRFCPHCRKHRQFKWRRSLTAAVDAMPKADWKLITLTRAHDDTPLKAQLKHLRASFRRLRQTGIWKQAIAWGIAVIEVSYNGQTRQWHPHLHILCPCGFIDYNHLRNAWRKATGGSHIIDVKPMQRPQMGVNYLAKYLGKPPSAALFHEDDRIHDYVDAMKSARMLLPFGSMPEAAKPKPEPKSLYEWKSLGSLASIVKQAHAGYRPAKQALSQITQHLQAARAQTPLLARQGDDNFLHVTLADHEPDP